MNDKLTKFELIWLRFEGSSCEMPKSGLILQMEVLLKI
jgi:hypothetical protein